MLVSEERGLARNPITAVCCFDLKYNRRKRLSVACYAIRRSRSSPWRRGRLDTDAGRLTDDSQTDEAMTRLVLIVVVLVGMVRAEVTNPAVEVDVLATAFRDDPGVIIAERISNGSAGPSPTIRGKLPQWSTAAVQTLYVDESRASAVLPDNSCGQSFQVAQNAWTAFAECNETQCIRDNGWIRDVLDSQGRRPSGLRLGNRYWLGEYLECLSISWSTNGTFKGRYCKATIPTDTIGDVLVGICAPTNCTGEDIYGAVSRLTQLDGFSISCGENLPQFSQDYSAMAALTGCCLILSLLILSTMIDGILLRRFMKSGQSTHDIGNVLVLSMHRTEGDGGPLNCLLAFSVLTNGARFMANLDTPGQIRCLYGVRVLSFVWVAMFHSMITALPRAHKEMWTHLDNNLYIPKVGKLPLLSNLFTVAFLDGAFGTDAFFVMSGLVLAYNWLKRMQLDTLNSPWYWLKFCIRRYIRLTPVYALLVWLYSELYYYLPGSGGPLWPEETHMCRDGWWRNLFYLNNFGREWTCMIHTWYLASEFQFYLLSPLLLIPLAVFPKLALGLGAALVIGDGISRGVYYGVKNLPPASMQGLVGYNEDYWEIAIAYMRPYRRAGPYVMGLMLGYVLFTIKNNHRRHGWLLKHIVWFSLIVPTIFCCVNPYLPGPVPYDSWAIGVHSGMIRIIFGLLVSWTIYSCETGNAAAINRFLSWKGFRFLAPLTYCAYLVHFLCYFYIFQSGERAPHFDSNLSFAFSTIKCIALTFPLATILHLSMEVPAMELEKLIFNKAPKPRLKNHTDMSNPKLVARRGSTIEGNQEQEKKNE